MLFELLTNILFPPVCIVCERSIGHGVICETCFSTIEIRNGLMCGECHLPLAATGSPVSQCHPDSLFILGAATSYEDKSAQSLIHHLKFKSVRAAAEPLGELLYNYASRHLDLADYVAMPIPLSRRRARSRGYNQAELIARHFAVRIGLPIEVNALVRAKHMKPQSGTTSEAERKENIRGAFAVRDTPAARAAIAGRHILLIDDVSTSGSTFLEASRMLKLAGAKKIIALAVAKT
jgi:ComF family protein